MAYASQSLGSTPFGGLSGGLGNPTPDTVELTLAINTPIIYTYSLPSSLAAGITVNAPAPVVSPAPPTTVGMTLTAESVNGAPSPTPVTLELNETPLGPTFDATGELSTQILNFTQWPPLIHITGVIQSVVSATVSTVSPIPTPTATPAEVSGSLTPNGVVIGASPGGLVQQLLINTLVPTPRIYSLPATLAGTITVQIPTVAIVNEPVTQELTGTLNGITPVIAAAPDTIEMFINSEVPVPNVLYPGSTLNVGMTINAVTIQVKKKAFLFPLTINAGYVPFVGDLRPTIVRYIYDPEVTGGCPQCGTFMYKVGDNQLAGTVISNGRNFDIDKGRREDGYWKCGRCGFTLHQDRHVAHADGSRSGWGMKYSEVRADAPGDA